MSSQPLALSILRRLARLGITQARLLGCAPSLDAPGQRALLLADLEGLPRRFKSQQAPIPSWRSSLLSQQAT